MSNQINIDVVLEKLSRQISQLSIENAILTSQIESLQAQIQQAQGKTSESDSDFE